MEFIIGFLAGYMLTWPAFIVLCILGIIFEANEAHGWAVFVGLITATVAYFFFALSLTAIALYVAAYFAVGFMWSFWRYKRHCDKIVDAYKDSKNQRDKDSAIEYMRPTRMLNKITTWVIVWPFSMIENLVGDIINVIQSAITKFFKGVYTRIFDSAASKLAAPVVTTAE